MAPPDLITRSLIIHKINSNIMSNKTIKLQIVSNYQNYQKGQIIDIEKKQAVFLLTNGKAIRLHRKNTKNLGEKISNNNQDKINKKPKSND